MMVEKLLPARDRYLVERLRALRHLPPGTSLPSMRTLRRDERELLQELLALSDETDLLAWLQQRAARRVARIALRLVLGDLVGMSDEVRQAAEKSVPAPDYEVLLGGLLEPEHNTALHKELETLDQGGDDTDEQLRRAWRRVQLVCGHLPSSGVRLRDEHEVVLSELLQLPGEGDPLAWFETSQATFAARRVLSHLVDRFEVMRDSLAAMPTVKRLCVRQRLHPLDGVEIAIQELHLKPAGFLVNASVKLEPRRLGLAEGTSVIWHGFERIVDQSGAHYLTWVERLNAGSASFGLYEEQLTLAGYPALAAGCHEINFFCLPLQLEVMAVSADGRLHRLPDLVGDNLRWHLQLS